MKRALIIATLLMMIPTTAQAAPTDAEMIAKVVQAEAGNQCLEGKRLVAAVILNRVDNEVFPDTVDEVVSQQGQFSTYRSLASTEPTWDDMLAVKMEMETRSNTEVLFFRNGHYGCGKPMMKVGDHYFSTIK